MKFLEPRIVNGVNVIGPDLFDRDHNGLPLSPIATAFPGYRALVAGRAIHALHVVVMLECLEANGLLAYPNSPAEEEKRLCEDAVPLIVRAPVVLIRSDPKSTTRTFAADEMLQQLLPRKCIQFTGAHLAEVRKTLRQRGESWRISPPPHSVEEIVQYIQSSRTQVAAGTLFYQNASSGERFLTCEEFMRIRPHLEQNRAEALSRLMEIRDLLILVNAQGAPELSFFLPRGERLAIHWVQALISSLESPSASQVGDTVEAESLFDRFGELFAAAAGPDLARDDMSHPTWRTTMFCRLYGINEDDVEEVTLGLSPEFHLNVRWLPGAVRAGRNLAFEPDTRYRARSLITHFYRLSPDIVSINVGQVESSQTERNRTGEEREVYLAVLGFADGHEDIRLVRRMKWDVLHRLKRGTPVAQAIGETLRYRDYIFDRLRAIGELGIPVLNYGEILFTEEISGFGPVPMFFFERPYIPGMTTEKVPPSCYGREGFVSRLARLLGQAAAVSLILGRVHALTGHLFFDDGDEVVQFDADGFPESLVMVDTTGSFADWTSPVAAMLPQCLEHLAAHLEKARRNGAGQEEVKSAVAELSTGLTAQIARLQRNAEERSSRLASLFAGHGLESGGIRCRWEGILHRLHTTDTRELTRTIAGYLNPPTP